jgi:NodT family efflux transporter outer membrane factor (OMF) lipoprotein
MRTAVLRLLACSLCAAGLAACSVGPDYVRPAAPESQTYKETQGWKVAQPSDALDRGAWWKVYGDAKLNELMDQLNNANQTLVQAEASYRQAHALVAQARAAYFPTASVSASSIRASAIRIPGATAPTISKTDTLALDASWEPDLWGAVRRNVEESVANEQSSAATFADTRLSLQSEMATDYFQLRGLDATAKLLTETVAAYQKALQLTENQYKVGVAQRSDVVLAQTQLVSTQAQLVNVGVQRSQLEHAIAVLVGVAPSQLTLAAMPLTTDQIVPPAPTGVPSTLLERRPDVAVAERKAAAANAQIGVATAAYFPDLTLAASGGYESSGLAHWLTLPNRVWSLGPTLAETIFDGGLRGAQVDAARAAYDQSVASYRQTVLNAFQDVEDSVAALRILEQEDALQEQAVALAQRALELELNRYKAGTVAYSDVITSQTTLLTNQETEVSLLSQRVTYSVSLIKALGGGWDATHVNADDVHLGANESKS